ncbi:hypothetical protein PGTUg99_016496 [Puccinia graminis f. sp. tritici]|uniref:Uncharacterized protein n=1 Tax=Puccinia graminis f. sp. tritici TaxID=56615 RepID=A0A5B0PDV6_PUCGR|nr:hypothetical protein PGTUg99_016496 [Puccinia graminis f. sp. tritici]
MRDARNPASRHRIGTLVLPTIAGQNATDDLDINETARYTAHFLSQVRPLCVSSLWLPRINNRNLFGNRLDQLARPASAGAGRNTPLLKRCYGGPTKQNWRHRQHPSQGSAACAMTCIKPLEFFG